MKGNWDPAKRFTRQKISHLKPYKNIARIANVVRHTSYVTLYWAITHLKALQAGITLKLQFLCIFSIFESGAVGSLCIGVDIWSLPRTGRRQCYLAVVWERCTFYYHSPSSTAVAAQPPNIDIPIKAPQNKCSRHKALFLQETERERVYFPTPTLKIVNFGNVLLFVMIKFQIINWKS